jgi:hypothetical protein
MDINKEYEQSEIICKIKIAYELLISNDSYLINKDVNERSITHKFAVYLNSMFPGYDVDCEYNRNLNKAKEIELEVEDVPSDNIEAKTVFPDIIVHKRGETGIEANLIVIECKKGNLEEVLKNVRGEYDMKKLKAYKSPQLGYTTALFITFNYLIQEFEKNYKLI